MRGPVYKAQLDGGDESIPHCHCQEGAMEQAVGGRLVPDHERRNLVNGDGGSRDAGHQAIAGHAVGRLRKAQSKACAEPPLLRARHRVERCGGLLVSRRRLQLVERAQRADEVFPRDTRSLILSWLFEKVRIATGSVGGCILLLLVPNTALQAKLDVQLPVRPVVHVVLGHRRRDGESVDDVAVETLRARQTVSGQPPSFNLHIDMLCNGR
mmetsp:Transcript_12949/g.38057  ORF Transcript_12949/g.38057 Transcript_12949/m.38057 type:complete len:211 (-) Transcript_12949:3-635(-)